MIFGFRFLVKIDKKRKASYQHEKRNENSLSLRNNSKILCRAGLARWGLWKSKTNFFHPAGNLTKG